MDILMMWLPNGRNVWYGCYSNVQQADATLPVWLLREYIVLSELRDK